MEPSTKQELRTEECVQVIEMGMQSTRLTEAGWGRIDKNLKLLQYLKPLKKATITNRTTWGKNLEGTICLGGASFLLWNILMLTGWHIWI